MKIDSWLLKGAVPAQKAIQGSQTDMGVVERNAREKYPPVIDLPSRQLNNFLQKAN